MFKINFPEPNSEVWTRWRNKCRNKTAELIASFRRGEAIEIDENLYKAMKTTYYENFHGKCAYCEKKIEKPYESELEHYRPKKEVTYVNDKPVTIIKNGVETKHPGYYWLVYDWENLLISCQICNKPNNNENSKLGKRRRFPLRDNNYAIELGEEAHEQELLINPVKEDPRLYLKYDSETGHINEIDKSDRGQTCKEIFGLNVRDDLVEGRKDAFDKVLQLLSRFFATRAMNERREILKELRKIKVGEKPHSIAALTAFEEYSTEIASLLH